ALRLFAAGHFDVQVPEFRCRLEKLAGLLRGLPCETTLTDCGSESYPRLEITLSKHDAFDVCRRLRVGKPPIYVGHGKLAERKLLIHPLHLDDTAIEAIGRRMRETLTIAL
ncbi:MAG: aminotransferase class V-fold PLP-dependent enzyme, partial [Candidatus Acidiferrum sp.]